jgi:hypothetical protein
MVKAHVLQHFQAQKLAAIDEFGCSSASRLHQLYTSKRHVQSIAMIKYGDKLPMHVLQHVQLQWSTFYEIAETLIHGPKDTTLQQPRNHEKWQKNKINPISHERKPATRETQKSFKYCTTHFLNVCTLISNRLRTYPFLSQQKLPQMYINLIIVLFPPPAYNTLSTPLKDIAGPMSLYLAVHNKSYSSLSKKTQ